MAQTPSRQLLSLIVFTDLDGSLLDHHGYRWDAARSGLDALRQAGVPVVIMSSKTAAEIQVLAQQLDLTDYPFSAENGAIIHLPRHWVSTEEATIVTLGRHESDLQQILNGLRAQGFLFEGFSDVSPETIAEWTGLPLEQALLAQQREATEPLLWLDSEVSLHTFRQLLEARGYTLQRGGRFYHVMPRNVDKGRALQWLMTYFHETDNHRTEPPGIKNQSTENQSTENCRMCSSGSCSHKTHNPIAPEHQRRNASYRDAGGQGAQEVGDEGRGCKQASRPLRSLALGDGENDLSMLSVADNGVLIRSCGGPTPRAISLPESVYRADHSGPEGWIEGLRYWYPSLLR